MSAQHTPAPQRGFGSRPLDCLMFGCKQVSDEHDLLYCCRCMRPPPRLSYSIPRRNVTKATRSSS